MSLIAVLGAGGFIGSHLVRRLKADGHDVIGVDIKLPEFAKTAADQFDLIDLTNQSEVEDFFYGHQIDTVYQLATDMGGAGYIFTGDVDAQVMHTGASINLHVLEEGRKAGVGRFFFSSSACVYPQGNQTTTDQPDCREETVLPAHPDSEYGWEKLFAERLYQAYARNYGLSVHIARFHSIVGTEGTWTGGKEKVFAALCRKIAEAEDGGHITIWGDGEQTRTFLYVHDCVDAIVRLTASDHQGPFNVGSEELVSINTLARMIMQVAGKNLAIFHADGPLGVRGRQSVNDRITKAIGWRPTLGLKETVALIYPWVAEQVAQAKVGA